MKKVRRPSKVKLTKCPIHSYPWQHAQTVPHRGPRCPALRHYLRHREKGRLGVGFFLRKGRVMRHDNQHGALPLFRWLEKKGFVMP